MIGCLVKLGHEFFSYCKNTLTTRCKIQMIKTSHLMCFELIIFTMILQDYMTFLINVLQ